MNGLARLCLAAAMGLSLPLHAFGWGTVSGPHGGTATTGPRGAGYAQGPNGGTAYRGPRGAGYAQGPNGGTAYRGPAGAGAAYGPNGGTAYRGPYGGAVATGPNGGTAYRAPTVLRHRHGLCSQAVGCGALLRIGRRGSGLGNDHRCLDTAATAFTRALLVLVQPGAYARVLGLLFPIEKAHRVCAVSMIAEPRRDAHIRTTVGSQPGRHNRIAYNRFHTTAMCSPPRASLLTGRNHHRVGNGQIAELANDWDGYSGRIPGSSALVAEVLKDYGYATAALGQMAQHACRGDRADRPVRKLADGARFRVFLWLPRRSAPRKSCRPARRRSKLRHATWCPGPAAR